MRGVEVGRAARRTTPAGTPPARRPRRRAARPCPRRRRAPPRAALVLVGRGVEAGRSRSTPRGYASGCHGRCAEPGTCGSLAPHDPAHHCPRHRLPRRHPRRLHGRARLRGARHRRRPGQGRSCSPRARSPSTSPSSSRCCASTSTSGRLRFTTSYAEVAAFGDVHFLCVGTPQRKGEYAADLRYVDAVVEALAPAPATGRAWWSASRPSRSARPPGWPSSSPSWRRPATGVELAWNPEFLREGFAVEDTLRPDRLVVGVAVGAAPRQLLREVYAKAIDARHAVPRHRLRDRRAGQGVRQRVPRHQDLLHQRHGRAVRGDRRRRHQLADAIGHDARIGRRFLNAGLGFGGGCLPKDIRAFMARAGELGVDEALTFLKEVDAINMRRRDHVVDWPASCCGGSLPGPPGRACWARRSSPTPTTSATPPPSTSPARSSCRARGHGLRPQGHGERPAAVPDLGYADSATRRCADADLVLHLTEWQEFRDLDPASARRGRRRAAHPRRPQRPRPGAVARRRLDYRASAGRDAAS